MNKKFFYDSRKGFKRKIYKIEDVMQIYEETIRKGKPMIVDNITLSPTAKQRSFLSLVYKEYKKHGEIRCPLCNTKASHFRMLKSGNSLGLFCFRKNNKHQTYYIPFNIDHIVPKSKQGSNKMFNKQLTCIRCNSLKGNFKVENINEIKEENYKKGLEKFNKVFNPNSFPKHYRFIAEKCIDMIKPVYNKLLEDFFKLNQFDNEIFKNY